MINIREHLKQGQNNHKGQSGQGGMPQRARSELKKKKKKRSKLHRARENESEPMRTRSKIKPISGAWENAIGLVAINFASDLFRGWR